MTLLGLSHSHGPRDSDGHGGLGHGHHHLGHGSGHATLGARGTHSTTVHQSGHAHGAGKAHGSSRSFWILLSPRVIFSLVLAFGAAGLLLQGVLGGPLLVIIALACAFAFERWLVQPLFSFLLQFASTPARTLESVLLEEAEAVANFDSRGEGLIAVHLNGEVVQLLAKLEGSAQSVRTRVRTGDRLMVTAVNPKRNMCTVSPLRR